MSEIKTTKIIGENGVDAVNFSSGLNVTGISTATNVSVASSVTAGTLFGNGAGLTNAGGGILLKKTAYTISRQTMTHATFPADDTIPQIDEGTQFFSQAYTPSTANCDIVITATCRVGETSNVGDVMAIALYVNDSTDALRVVSGLSNPRSSIHCSNMLLVHKMPSWGVSAKTFSLRGSGGNAINYGAGGYDQYDKQYFGDTTHSTLFIIEEIST